jgi:hypothetical protein
MMVYWAWVACMAVAATAANAIVLIVIVRGSDVPALVMTVT